MRSYTDQPADACNLASHHFESTHSGDRLITKKQHGQEQGMCCCVLAARAKTCTVSFTKPYRPAISSYMCTKMLTTTSQVSQHRGTLPQKSACVVYTSKCYDGFMVSKTQRYLVTKELWVLCTCRTAHGTFMVSQTRNRQQLSTVSMAHVPTT